MKLYTLEIPSTEASTIFTQLAALPYSLFLDSADRNHPDARYSFIAAQPVETIESRNGMVRITNAEQQTSFPGDPFIVIESRLKAWGFAEKADSDLPPFQGGAAGFFGYDIARGIENLPSRAKANPDMPDMAIGIYDQVIAFDHKENKAWIITHAENKAAAETKRRFLLSCTEAPAPATTDNNHEIKWNANFTAETYKAHVAKVIQYIRAGDIFQANLSQRFDAALPAGFDPYAHYMDLRSINPAPFAAFMNAGPVTISSASPERFLTVKDRLVQTKPIKGTVRRLQNPANDEEQKSALLASDKDRAENIMIVDLLRNDLSKSCEAPSVTVETLCGVESFAGVHHLVSTITGRLKEEHTPLDLLRACFPGGSITGAPKIRAMEIIEELEPTRRGPYCGCLGYIGFNGTMDMNILIRTLVYTPRNLSFQTGGGITLDSIPEKEYEETLDKAGRIFDSFETFPTKAAGRA